MRDTIHWLTAVARLEERLDQARNTVARSRHKQQLLSEVGEEESASLAGLRRSEEEAAAAVRARERDVRDRDARLARKRAQLDLVKDNREYAALKEATAAAADELDRAETAALEAIERLETVRAEIRAREERIGRELDDLSRRRSGLADAAAEAGADIPGLESEVEKATAQLPPEIAAVVRRLRGGLPLPVVWLENGSCSLCGAHLPQQRAIAVSRGEILQRCQGCGRYLVARP